MYSHILDYWVDSNEVEESELYLVLNPESLRQNDICRANS